MWQFVFNLLFCLDLFQCGVFSHLEDPTLQQLVPQMMELLVGSSAANTVSKYSAGWKRWKSWAATKLGVPVLPAIPFQVSLYLTELVKNATDHRHSVAVIEAAAYSIRWGHRLAGMDSPTDHSLVKSVIEGARRKLARPIKPKEPLCTDIVAEITKDLNTPNASLADIRFLFILLVGYAGIFRVSEILNIRVKDIEIFDSHMTISVDKRKNDQYRRGHVSTIARSGKPTCPVGITEKILSLLPDDKNSPYPVVRRIVPCRYKKQRFHQCLGISYTSVRDNLKAYIGNHVSDTSLFGTHSIKAAGCNDPGFKQTDDSLKDRHGGWKNPKSKLRYIDLTNSEDLIQVTRSMSI